MKKVNIIKDGKIVQHAIFPDDESMNTWIALLSKDHAWGKPDRWVREDFISSGNEDVSKAIGQLTEDDMGKEYQVYHFSSEYEVEIIDITSEVEAEKAIKAAKEAKKADLAALKGKSLSTSEIKQAVELFIELWPI